MEARAPEYEALQNVFERLYDTICPEGITVALHGRNLLSKVEADTIRSKATTHEKNEELLFAISRRSPAQVVQFCQYLLEKQSHCGNILKEALQARGVDTSSLTVAALEPSAVSHVAAKYYPQIDDLDVALAALVQKMKGSTKTSEHLKTCCIRFLATLSRIHSHDTKDARARLAAPDCQNEEAIDIIQGFVDPLDCHLLCKIVSALDDKNLMVAWDDYCQRSKQACRITLEQCRKVAIRPHQLPPSGITLGMQTKISPPDITIQKILQLKEFLITKVGLEEIDFNGFACSAVALFFTVGRDRLPVLIRLLSCHQKALLDFTIVIVFVPGEFFYDVAKDQAYPCPKDDKVQESMGTSEQASSFANVESRFSAALERIEHAQMAVQKKEELVHMERKEVEKERLQNQVQSLVRDNLKLQDENHLLEEQLLQRLDALQEMMGGGAEAEPQGEGVVPEKDLPVVEFESTSDVKSELSEPPSKKSELQELEPEEKEDVGTLQESLEDNEALLEEYGMKVKAWSDVPRTVKTLREQNDALAEKEEALKERDKALREKDELVRLMAIMQPTFEDVQSAFIRYGIQVGAWEDVPRAVQQLAHKQGKEPLPDVLLQRPTCSDILLVWDIIHLWYSNWRNVAAHLGCLPQYIQDTEKEQGTGLVTSSHRDHVDIFDKRCRTIVPADWLARKEGTGSMPRTWETVLEAFRRCCAHFEEGLTQLISFEDKLIHGIKWY